LDVRRPAIHAALLAGFELEPELRRNDRAIAERRERFADELLVRERAVRFSRVEERDAAIEGRSNEGDHLLRVVRRTVAEAHAYAAEAQRRNLQAALSKSARLHRILQISVPASCLSSP